MIAVIYTGELRTIDKTISFLKKNVVLNENVHIFATLQSEEYTLHEEKIKNILGKNCKSLNWFFKNDDLWLKTQEKMLNNIPINISYKNYIKNGGSMIEYYQLQLSYEKLALFELENGINYDYIIRCRTDTIFCQPIDFSWLSLSSEEIKFRLSYIKDLYENISNDKLITLFMSTIINRNLLSNIENNNLLYDDSPNPKENQYINKNDFLLQELLKEINIEKLQNYIKNGLYILTIRKNLLYIVKREFFGLIPAIGTMYGSLNFFKNEYWWNAESQFRSACAYSQLSIFNYSTIFEENSLYNYKEENYFDDGKIKKEMLYCLIRK